MGAGVPPIVGAVAMCAIRCFPDRQEKGGLLKLFLGVSFCQHVYISEAQDAAGKLLKVSETTDTVVENA